MEDMIWVGRETTPYGFAELHTTTTERDKVYVTYYRKSGRLINVVKGGITKKIIEELLTKIEKRVKKMNMILWSY